MEPDAFLKVNVPGTLAGDRVTLDMKSASVSFNTTLMIFGKMIWGFGIITEKFWGPAVESESKL
jgi:hypothetical protein